MDSTVSHEFEIVHDQIDAICDELDVVRKDLATLSGDIGRLRSLVEAREAGRDG